MDVSRNHNRQHDDHLSNPFRSRRNGHHHNRSMGKNLGQFGEKFALAKMNMQAIQQSQAPEGVKRSEPVAKASLPTKAKTEPNPEPKSLSRIYQIKHPTTIRLEPNFESVSIGKFPPGTKVTVIRASGDWVEVRTDDAGLAGFIRREFVTPTELNQKSKTGPSQ